MDQKDSLTVSSRNFYEHARLKVALSIAAGGLCMFFLGLTSSAGGEANAAQKLAKDANLAGGYMTSPSHRVPVHMCGGKDLYMYISCMSVLCCVLQMSYIQPSKMHGS
jgi:hypothetical protein